ncbi:ComEA family DNA-binding protein [Fulvivirga sediminis]|uniref:Helix-hairpin-helix domain-containing protein n=1 Tax=Fulvivirga sediminis TaxID=2803949 RepID=A0A937K1X6_9BACT|nr:helix-hairpin-helix domain-containing protein [Fulvivirga sediminis]MBL3657956.1 helix-hairpin-helix domain-containing protein [Fulvivirga sediminis]
MRWLFIFLCIYISSCAFPQKKQQDFDLQLFIENIFSVQDGDLNYEELYESLLLYYTHPLNINKADKDDLRALYILNDQQINNIISYREKYGDLLSIYELQAIPGLTMGDIRKMIPFITVKDYGLNKDQTSLIKRILNEPNNYFLVRYERTLETKKGYTPPTETSTSRYKGAPYKLYNRFRVSHTKDFSLGYTLEKDAGEPLAFNSKTNGFDFYSFHFQLQNQGKLRNLIIGDYQLQFGQGLLLSSGFNIGKGGETITTVRRSNLGARPYTSVVETGFFRGATATYAFTPQWQLTTFYSRLHQDAVIRSDSADSYYEFISSVQSSGFHRTESEIAAKNQITEQTLGAHLLYKDANDNLQVGITYLNNHYSTALIKSPYLYNQFEFTGIQNHNLGVSVQYNWNNLAFFSEAARSKSGGIGAIGGMILNLSRTLECSVVLRNYQRNFHSFYGSAFAEAAGKNINEKGWYWGLKYSPFRKFQLSAYFDKFNFPWLKFGISSPSGGYEYLARANYKPNRKSILYFQYRRESKANNYSLPEQPMTITTNGIKDNYIFNIDIEANDIISLKTRLQLSNYNFAEQRTHGMALIQDLNIDLKKLRISTRLALFDTDDYQNRQYAYERDVLYSFSIPAYYGKGTRQYIVVRYKINQHLDFWIKYAQTLYRNQERISSGLEEITGDTKTDLKVQMRLRF